MANAITRNVGGIASHAGKFLAKHVGNVRTIGKSLAGGNLRDPMVMKDIARASFSLYMGANIATYGARMASGRGPFTNRKGKSQMLIGIGGK